MEEVQIFTKEAIKQLKDGVKSGQLDEQYTGNENAWIEPYIQKKGNKYVRDHTDFRVVLPTLKYGEKGNSTATDIENAIAIYEHLRLQPYQAADMRLWVSLTHYTYWDYMQYRWPIKDKNRRSNILSRYFDGEKPFSRNGLARLWWSVHLTVDDTAKTDTERYRYTKLFWNDQDKVDNLSSYNLCHIKPLLWAVLATYERHSDKFTNREKRRLFIKRFNQFGGIKSFGALSKDQLFDIVEAQAILFHE